MSDNEILREFLLETHENLALLDEDLLHLEQHPTDRSRLSQVFRTFHSIKGTAGFMGLAKLQAIAHSAENLLSHLRSGQLQLDRPIATLLLQLVDAIREIVSEVELSGNEGPGDYASLSARVEQQLQASGEVASGLEAAPLPTAPSVAPSIAPSVAPLIEPGVTMELPPLPAAVPTGDASPAGDATASAGTSASPEAAPLAEVAFVTEAKPLPPVTAAVEAPAALQQVNAAPPAASLASVDVMVTSEKLDPKGADAQGSLSEVKEPSSGGATESSLRVDVRRLDQLMTLVGELVLARNQLLRYRDAYEDQGFLNAIQRLDVLTSDLQASVMNTRLQPIGTVLNRFPRVVRDLALACGKRVRLELEGQETELDKTLIEAIRDPLTHLVRNAIDHGIELPELRQSRSKSEEGLLRIEAFHEGGKVIVEISDDGGGIDVDRVRDRAVSAGLVSSDGAARMTTHELLQLVFLPGFSTAREVTEYSGRGVGMDVVRTNIERIGGAVELESTPSRGTKIRTRIPLTLTILPALIVACGQERFAIPQSNLLELVRLEPEQAQREIEYVHDAPVLRLRGKLVPLVFLDQQLQLPSVRTSDGATNLVILQVDERSFGLVVDSVHDVEEIVVKPLQKQLKEVAVFAGAAIMGDGRIALVMDVLSLAQQANVTGAEPSRDLTDSKRMALSSELTSEPMLLFSRHPGQRLAIPLSQVARLEEIPRSRLEWVQAGPVAQCRGEILPLIDLAGELQPPRHAEGFPAQEHPASGPSAPLVVIVVTQEQRRIGLIVHQIVDVVQEPITATTQPVSLVQGRVTEITDISALLRDETRHAGALRFETGGSS